MGVRPLEGFTEDDGGKLLIGIEGGLRRFSDGKLGAYPLPGTVRPFLTRRLLRDHDGGLWIAAYNAGLVHIHDGKRMSLDKQTACLAMVSSHSLKIERTTFGPQPRTAWIDFGPRQLLPFP